MINRFKPTLTWAISRRKMYDLSSLEDLSYYVSCVYCRNMHIQKKYPETGCALCTQLIMKPAADHDTGQLHPPLKLTT
jgi:hypothetical protein